MIFRVFTLFLLNISVLSIDALALETSSPSPAAVALIQKQIANWPIEIFKQAESVEQELLKKLKINSQSSQIYFGKLKSVFFVLKSMKDRVPNISCQRYEFQVQTKQMLSVSEACLVKSKTEIIYIEQSKENELKVTFLSSKLSSVIGLAASIMQSKSICNFKMRDKELVKITCDKLAYSKGYNEVLFFDEFNYEKESEPVIFAKGKWYKDVLAERSIAVTVPKVGAIKIVETVLRAPKPIVTKEAEKKETEKKPAKKKINPHADPNMDPRDLEKAASEEVKHDIDGALPEVEVIDVSNEKPKDIKPTPTPRESGRRRDAKNPESLNQEMQEQQDLNEQDSTGEPATNEEPLTPVQGE